MRASAAVTVERPIEDVWAYVADVTRMDEWVSGVVDPVVTSEGTFGEGSTFESRYEYGGRTHEIDYEVTAFDPPERFATRATSGPFPFEGEVTLESVPGGTRVTNVVDAGSDSRATTAIFTLFGPVVRWLMGRRLADELEALAARLEASAGDGSGASEAVSAD